jgi:hypothetical protein
VRLGVVAGVAVVVGGAWRTWSGHRVHMVDQDGGALSSVAMGVARKLSTSADVLAALEGIEGEVDGPWSLAQVLVHCAQSVELSLTGYPSPRGWVVRRVIGPRVMAKFLRQGFMTHDRAAPIPGAPPLGEPTLAEGVARLRSAIVRFDAHEGPLAPHFAYGEVDKRSYETLHAMHVADHLAVLRSTGALGSSP